MPHSNGWRLYFEPIRQRVLERDGYRCCRCGSQGKLIIHHLDGRGWDDVGHSYQKDAPINNDDSNLLTLCNRCHRIIHGAARNDIDIQRMIELKQSGETFQVIGNIFGVSRQRIHQLVSKIFR